VDLYRLCEERQIECLRDRIVDFVSSDSGFNFLSVLLSLCDSGCSTTPLESALGRKLISLLDDDRLMKVPAEMLDRVIDFRQIEDYSILRRLLEFCVSFINRVGLYRHGFVSDRFVGSIPGS
jgi:hypothetical protein